MIPNPPSVILALRTWKRIRTGVPTALHAEYLAALFRRLCKPGIPYDTFLNLYNLYLQQIPLALAKEAWGIVAADSIRHAQTQPKPFINSGN